ncbi:hypothetical protein [Tissierella pigra]|uniref:Uncharacterized protein n=1 Tax=Tissierella pigra TaxID=2607614 RepID=A0A6N7XYR0_9FIRM|nr:hypothetical protein [Tissierella pigra]MSU01388.1 hypothetical protein [Tissierella pigra]
MSLEKLEKKVEERAVKPNVGEAFELKIEENRDLKKISSSVDAVYRLVDNTTRRIERSLLEIKNKQNLIIKLLESEGLDFEELQKQEEIKQLENKLKELRGE